MTSEERLKALEAKRAAFLEEQSRKIEEKKRAVEEKRRAFDEEIRRVKKRMEPTRKERTHMRLVGIGALLAEAKTDERLKSTIVKVLQKHRDAAEGDRQKRVFDRLIEEIG